MEIGFKRTHTMTPKPERMTSGSVGFDLVAVDAKVNYEKQYIEYKTGLSLEIPEGYGGFIFARSSISKTPHSLANAVGVIDSDYRGEIAVRMRFNEYNVSNKESDVYSIGDRIAQLVILPVPSVTFKEKTELSDTVRGSGGFGSTNK